MTFLQAQRKTFDWPKVRKRRGTGDRFENGQKKIYAKQYTEDGKWNVIHFQSSNLDYLPHLETVDFSGHCRFVWKDKITYHISKIQIKANRFRYKKMDQSEINAY